MASVFCGPHERSLAHVFNKGWSEVKGEREKNFNSRATKGEMKTDKLTQSARRSSQTSQEQFYNWSKR